MQLRLQHVGPISEAEDEYRTSVRRGSDDEAKPKRKNRRKQRDSQ